MLSTLAGYMSREYTKRVSECKNERYAFEGEVLTQFYCHVIHYFAVTLLLAEQALITCLLCCIQNYCNARFAQLKLLNL